MARHFSAMVWVAGSFVFPFEGLEYIVIGIGIPRNYELISLSNAFTLQFMQLVFVWVVAVCSE